MKALVIPSVREHQLHQFLDAWRPHRFWDRLIVVEDNSSHTFKLNDPDLVHLCWHDFGPRLNSAQSIISRRDSAVRSFGFLTAWDLGAEVIFTLDDDTRPIAGVDHGALHLRALQASPRWVESIPGMRTRGLPYQNRGTLDSVVCNMGTWSGVPDLDAVGSLALGCPTDFAAPRGSRVLAQRQYAPVCGMNLAFRREFTPLAYFGLQGHGQPYSRFDDIWFGVWAKRICDHLGWSIAVGDPPVRHLRASDPFVNLMKEAPGIVMNESFWQLVDGAPLTSSSPAGCLAELGEHFLSQGANPYMRKLGRAVQLWAGLFAA